MTVLRIDFSLQLSAISSQPSVSSHQPSAISIQLTALSNQQSAFSFQLPPRRKASVNVNVSVVHQAQASNQFSAFRFLHFRILTFCISAFWLRITLQAES
jgi:hypothetical protein